MTPGCSERTGGTRGRPLPVRISDVFPASEHVGRYLLHTQFPPDDAARISIHARPYNTTRYHLILPRTLASSKGTLARDNRGLARLKQSGRYDKYLADLEAGRY
jgi:polar amino acid transport system substrate-binding protein